MGYIHFIRSGGIPGAGKTLLASMLFEFCRSRKAPCHYIDAQKSPEIGSRIWLDPRETTRLDRLIELAEKSEVIVDVPASTDYLLFEWFEEMSSLIRKGSLQVADWFLNNQTPASWEASQVQAKFWQDLGLRMTPQIFVLNGYFPTQPGAFPGDAQQQCWDNNVGMMFFCAPEGVVLPKNQPIGEVINNSRWPYSKPLKDWREKCAERFISTTLIPEPPQIDFSGTTDLREMAYLALGRTQSAKAVEAIDDAPWI
jgi:hypothetical protein